MARASNNPAGRPAAPCVGELDPYFAGLLTELKEERNITILLWAGVVGISFSVLKAAFDGVGGATFRIRSYLARIAAAAGCPLDRVTVESHVLPTVDPATVIADLTRLAELGDSPYRDRHGHSHQAHGQRDERVRADCGQGWW